MAKQQDATGERPATGGFLVGLSDDLATVVDMAGRSVVRVSARRRVPGSGILWTTDGLVVTADHIVEVEEGIRVGLPDGRDVEAQLLARDPGTDLAILQANAGGLVAADVDPDVGVKVGNLVLAIARPGEGGPMASIGIASAITGPWRTRRGSLLQRLIQTDCTMYPGFSGGPLVNAAGRVVGLNSSILARGASVAVPVETVRKVVEALLTQGKVRKGYLGVSTQPVLLPVGLVQKLALAQGSGLLVVGVVAGGPAEAGGVMLGDVLITMDGLLIRDADDLQGLLGPERVGSETAVRVIRGGELCDLRVKVGERE